MHKTHHFLSHYVFLLYVFYNHRLTRTYHTDLFLVNKGNSLIALIILQKLDSITPCGITQNAGKFPDRRKSQIQNFKA